MGLLKPQPAFENDTTPQSVKGGTWFGQFQLRGSILVIKDKTTTKSGYLAFGTSITTIPTSPTAGTGIYVDYRGVYGLASNTQQFYLQASDGKAYAGAGTVVLNSDGIQLSADDTDANSYKIMADADPTESVMRLYTKLEASRVETYLRSRGSDSDGIDEGYLSLEAKTADGSAIGGLGAVTLELDTASGEFRVRNGTAVCYGNLAVGDGVTFGGGDEVLALKSASTLPSSNPTGGGLLYVDAGTLKYRGPSGTITPLAVP